MWGLEWWQLGGLLWLAACFGTAGLWVLVKKWEHRRYERKHKDRWDAIISDLRKRGAL